MSYIVIQQDNSPVLLTALKHLVEIGDCGFKLSFDGLRLRNVLFGSRSNLSFEEDYHSFVGELACARWSIAHNRCYFWGKKLFF